MPPAETSPLPMRHTRRVLREPEQFADIVSGMSLTVEFRRRQERPSQVEQFQTTDLALDFGEAQVKCSVRGVLPAGWASVCLVRGPAEAAWNGQPGTTGMLCCVPPGEELEGHTVPGFSWMTIALPPSAWAQCRMVAGVDDRLLHRYTACQLTGPQLAHVEQQVRITHGLLTTRRDDSQAMTHAQHHAAALATQIATAVWEATSGLTPPRLSVRNRTRLARRAVAWMHDHLGEPIRVPDLCLALRVSRRELELAFRATFDQSPREYLQALRLHAIRRELRHRRDSVTRVALDYGITHLGRLATNYRLLFGESPNETLSQRAAPHFPARA